MKKLLSSLAKVGVATSLDPTGASGLVEAGTEAVGVVGLLSGREKDGLAAAVRRVEKGLEASVEREKDQVGLKEALRAAESIVKRSGPAAALAGAGFDPAAAARRLVEAAGEDLGPADPARVRRLLVALLELLAREEGVLRDSEAAFLRVVLAQLGRLEALAESTAAAVLAAAPAALLYEPSRAWRKGVFPPSALLRAEHAIVPFFGRKSELDDLEGWCDGGAEFGLRLYTGAGGMGKTRLMLEACKVRRAAGWRAGFLARADGAPPPAACEAMLRAGRPLFVVIDYAETRPDAVAALLRPLARGTGRGKVRIVLLARAWAGSATRGPDWWELLLGEGEGVGDLLAGPCTEAPREVAALVEVADRPAAHEKAAAAFARALGRPAPVGSPPTGLSDEGAVHLDRALFLYLDALAFVLGERPEGPGGLLDFALRREREFFARLVEERKLGGIDGRALAQAAALATLAGNLPDAAWARAVLARAPLLAGQPAATVAQVAEILRELYPGPAWLAGVQPDLLGEHLVAREVAEDGELVDAAFAEGAEAGELEHGLTVLTRIAQREELGRETEEMRVGRPALRRAFRGRLGRLALPAVRVAQETGDPVGKVLAEALAAEPELEVAKPLIEAIPHQTTALREVAVVAGETIVANLRGLSQFSRADRVELSRFLNNLSIRLYDLGRKEEALLAIGEAVGLYRDLARGRSGLSSSPYLLPLLPGPRPWSATIVAAPPKPASSPTRASSGRSRRSSPS